MNDHVTVLGTRYEIVAKTCAEEHWAQSEEMTDLFARQAVKLHAAFEEAGAL